MKDSAFEAIMTSVNIFIFIIALTISITLMVQVLNTTSASGDLLVKNLQGSIYAKYSKNNDRLYNLSDILGMQQKYDPENTKYQITVLEGFTETSLDNYEANLSYFTINKYKLSFKTQSTDNIMTFELI